MKNYLLILTGILFVCCQSQPERPFTEAEKLADKQYYQFFEMKIPQSKVCLSRRKQEMQKRKSNWEDAMQNAPI